MDSMQSKETWHQALLHSLQEHAVKDMKGGRSTNALRNGYLSFERIGAQTWAADVVDKGLAGGARAHWRSGRSHTLGDVRTDYSVARVRV